MTTVLYGLSQHGYNLYSVAPHHMSLVLKGFKCLVLLSPSKPAWRVPFSSLIVCNEFVTV